MHENCNIEQLIGSLQKSNEINAEDDLALWTYVYFYRLH